MSSNILRIWIKKLGEKLLSGGGSGRSRRLHSGAANRRATAKPTLENLEDRVVPAGNVSALTQAALQSALTGGGLVTFNGCPSGTIVLSSALSISANTTIQGPGPLNGSSGIAISGNNTVEDFSISAGVTATISGLTIEFGHKTTGGGIYNSGTLTLTNDTVTGNSATASGGAVFNTSVTPAATLTVNDSTFTNNTAAGLGGGAIYNSAASGKNSSVPAGTATVNNSTFYNNRATSASFDDGNGGAIDTAGILNLTNDTIAGNSASTANSGAGYGGGIYIYGGSTTSLDNTIVAGNSAGKNTGLDVDGTVNTATYDLLSTNAGTTGITSGSNGNIVNASPGLAAALASNGGLTQTLALLSGSPAARAGDPAQATATTGLPSQNAVTRPATPDIGAYQTAPPSVTTNTGNLANNSLTMVINGSYFDTNIANDTVTFNNSVTAYVSAATTTSLTVTFTGGLGALPNNTALDAVVTTLYGSSNNGVPVQVANVTAPVVPPSVTFTTANIADSSTSLTITGSNFNTTAADNTVAFNLGVTGTVTSVNPGGTQLTVAITSPPTALSALTAIVTNTGNGANSGAAEQVATVENGTWTVTDSGSGAGSFSDITLPYAVATYLGGDTIAFASGLSGSIITLTGTLTLNNNVTITGLGAANLAISGNSANEVFRVSSGVTATINGLTIEHGQAATGGGIFNSGTLTLSNDALSGNTATDIGGAVYGAGSGTSLTVNNSTFSSNAAVYGGGAIYNYTGGTATVANSTFFGNSTTGAGSFGGGENGGAVDNFGTLNLTDDTLSGNSATGYGGGIYGSVASMDNTIVAGNSAGKNSGQDINGTVTTANYDLIGTSSGTTGITSGADGNIVNASPGLASALANNGGSTPTLAVLPGSPAIGTGDPGQAGTTAQNGLTRSATPTIGAYQSPSPTVTASTANLPVNSTSMYIYGTGFDTNTANDFITFDNGVSGTVSTATATSFLVSLTGLNSVPIGTVLYASVTVDGISSGNQVAVATVSASTVLPVITISTASLPDSSTTLTINGANFDPIVGNNAVAFNLGVTGTITAATSSQLTVAVTAPPTALGDLTAVVTTDGNANGSPVQVATEINGTWTVANSGAGAGSFSAITLPYAVATALGGDTIDFASGLRSSTITTASTLTLNNSVTITGLGAADLAVSGNNAHEVFNVASGVTATISGLTIEYGSAATGGGIFNSGTLTLTNDILSGNTATDIGGAVYGAGSGTSLTVNNSTFSSNAAVYGGGAIYNYTGGTATVANSTFFGNSATGAGSFGGGENGGAVDNFGTLNLTDATISGNSASGYGGGIYGSVASMDNSIAASNSAGKNNGLDMYSNSVSANYSLIGNSSGITTLSGSNNIVNVSAGLAAALGNNGGQTPTLALLPGSPALSTGDPGQAGTMSQNLLTRPTPPDIGAYQTPPAVTATSNLPDSSSSLTINGSGFDSNAANNSITFTTLGVVGTVTSATGTQLIVAISTPANSLGSLDAVITTDGTTSGAPVQVATVVNGDWVVTDNNGNAGSGSMTDVTLPYAVAHALNGDSVSFDSSLNGDTITLNSTLTLNSSIAIIGPGAANLAVSSDPIRVFDIPSAVTATISGLTIENGVATLGGGVANYGTLTLSNDTITGNTATGPNFSSGGGGVYNAGTLTMSGDAITGNTAASNGGGVYNVGQLTVSNSTFTGNATYAYPTGDSGGGLFNNGTLTLSNSTFTDNNAAWGGGMENFNTATVTYCNFTGNSAFGGSGGGVNNFIGSMTLSNCTIADNTAYGPYGGSGGGVCNSDGAVLTLSNDTISGNSAYTGGGVNNGGSWNTGTLIMNNDMITGNTASSSGGGIYNDGTDPLSLSSVTLSGNSAVYGGGIFSSGTLTLTNDAFTGNSASDSGGGVFNAGALSLGNDTFSGNNAGNYGGGLLNNNGGTVTTSGNDAFTGNFALVYGGGIFNYGTTTLSTTTVTGNYTFFNGGGVYNDGTMSLTNAFCSNNSTSTSGGGIDNVAALTLSNSTLTANTADFGGGLEDQGSDPSTVTGCTFSYNTAFGTGGGIGNFYGTMTLSNSTVAYNSGGNSGGGIGNTGTLTLASDTIAYNSAYSGGGIDNVYNDNTPLTMDNTIVAGNNATNGPDVNDNIDVSNYNLIGDSTGYSSSSGSNNILDVSPGLSTTLAYNNGAPTETLALLPGSPAIATGDPITQPGTTAQNGVVRPAAPDIGAYQTVAAAAPMVASSTASLPANAATVTIDGTGFDTTAGNNTVAFNDGAAGTVTSATATSLTVTFSTDPTTAGSLTAVVTADSVTSGSPVQVATVTPVVTTNTAGMLQHAPTLTISGYGFDPIAANNTVTFNDGAAGSVTSATATTLTVTFSTAPSAAGSLTAVVTTDSVASGAAVQVATVSFVNSVVVNGDYAPIVDISSDGSGTVTAATDGNNGFTAGNTVVISGYTGANAGYDGTFTVQSASGDQFTVTNATAGLPTLSGNSAGFAISQNTASALRGNQRSMVDSAVYTFTAPVSLTASNFTLTTSAPSVSGAPSAAPAPATLYPGMALTSLAGGSIWVVSWVSGGGTGATVSGHSLADGVYNITLGNSNEGTDTFFRLYGNVIGFNSTSHTASLNNQDSLTFTHSYLLSTGATLYLADCDYDANGVINNTDSLNFTHRYLSVWSGFLPTI